MSGLKLRLNEVKDKFGLNQVIVIKLKAQWLSGLKLRLNEVKDKFGKLNQVIVIILKAQWLSGLKLRLNDLLETYSTVRGWTDKAKIIQFSTIGPLPTLRG
ncbi:hypothetical protein ACWOA6_05120 [Globicatella sulfidifaciens]